MNKIETTVRSPLNIKGSKKMKKKPETKQNKNKPPLGLQVPFHRL